MVVTLTGCGRLFDLEPPTLGNGHDDGGVHSDADGSASGADGQKDGPGSDGNTVAGCPSNYTTVLGTSTSRYRIVTNMAISWDSAQTQCLNDQVMNANRYTHLIVGASD